MSLRGFVAFRTLRLLLLSCLCSLGLSACANWNWFNLSDNEEPKQQIVLPDTVLFEFGRIAFNEKYSAPYFDRIAAILREQNDKIVRIEGHTDNVGSLEINQRISEMRAEAIRQELLIRGISGERMRAVGMAYSRPAADNDSEEGRKINRRVEITVLNENMSSVSRQTAANSFTKAFSELKDVVDDHDFKPQVKRSVE